MRHSWSNTRAHTGHWRRGRYAISAQNHRGNNVAHTQCSGKAFAYRACPARRRSKGFSFHPDILSRDQMNPADPVIPGSREARFNGLTIHYHDVGPRDGMPLVLLHGFMTSSYSWRDVWRELARDHRLYIVDLPGYGKSDCPRGRHSVDSF